MNPRKSPVDAVERYYTAKLREHGPTHGGVDWNSDASQNLRFEQLMHIVPDANPFSINDFGCGYGALAAYLKTRGTPAQYRGFDISQEMVATARGLHAACEFSASVADLAVADFTVASGVFNVKLDEERDAWLAYVLDTIATLNSLSRRGFAFNLLTSYSDAEYRRPHLYYGDPAFFFDHCKRTYSKNVALLHDYGLYEFTMLVRK